MPDTETDADTALPTRDETERGARKRGLGLSGLALVGVILFSVTFAGLVTAIFLLPPEHLRIPELQPAVRVAKEADFPIGASRIVAWGDEPILVVRGRERFWAVQGTSPFDGCILRWEAESLRVVSPCTYVVYDLRGNVVSGLSLIPLKPYTAFVRRGTLYVTG
jgi:nitrite reductase/ring-hydroxylating ferredoxin subunit